MKKCSEINDLISLYIDKKLDSEEIAEFEEHISGCSSCKEELEEVTKVIEISSDFEEVELPENFKQDLHNKLIEEKQIMERKNNFIILRNRYVKICGTIAAVLVLAIISKGFLGGFSHKASSDSSAVTGNVAMAIESPSVSMEKKADSPKAGIDLPSKNEKAAYDRADNTVVSANSGDEKQKSKIAKDALVSANDTAATFKVNDVDLRNTEITLKVEDPESKVVEIKEELMADGAEFLENNMDISFSVPIAESSVKAVEPKDIVITFKVLNEKLDQLINSLKTRWGETSIQVGTINIANIEDEIKQMETEFGGLNTKIDSSGGSVNNANADDVIRRNELQSELENIKRDINFTFVTLRVKEL